MTIITRDDMERNGYANVAQAVAALPSNFGGTATEQSALASADRTGSNSSLASGVNLRGLGADATLVLVNGRRIAGSGAMGDFGDLSSIPTGAVERVEVLLDGASAIYGSDAVGGVVNIILRKRFDGLESRVRLGSVTDGGARLAQIDQTFGKTWATGSVMLSYEYELRTALSSDDRAFARSADSRPLGGTDHRFYLSVPGNVLGFNPVTGAFGPMYAIPAGQDGTALRAGDFEPGVTNLQNFRVGVDLTPRQERHSAVLTLSQDVGDRVHLWAEGRFSHRRFEVDTVGAATIATVTPANPYFVSPTGAASDLIAYFLGSELGPGRIHGVAEDLAGSGGADAELGHGWRLSAYGAFAQERDTSTGSNTVNSAHLTEALGTTPDDPTTPFNTATDGYFNPYGDGHSNSPAVLSFVGDGYTAGVSRSRVVTGDVQADGPIVDLPAGAVKLAVGTDLRRESFLRESVNFISTTVPVLTGPASDARTVIAGYAELRVPLFGPANARPGLQRLDLSAAVRTEHYGGFGTTTNPKFGLNWAPVDHVLFRATYGTSFRAPNLYELNATQQTSTAILQGANGLSTAVIELGGGNPGLKAQTARSWTIGFDVTPPSKNGLGFGATLFRTVFNHRIGQPVSNDISNALINPDYAPFVQRVSPADAADFARVQALLANPNLGGGGALPAGTIGAIVDLRYVNTGQLDVTGLDATAHYGRDIGRDHVEIGLNGSYLFRYRQQLTPTSPFVTLLNLADEPVDLRGRATLGWTHGEFDALVGMNYVDRYRDLVGHRIGAWTTFDLQLAWRPTSGPFKTYSIALIGQNLFDRAPPFYDSSVGAGYDAANADATGRFLSLQLTKRW
jgi:outer membrane receptor protein involved in Fe transport